MYPRITGRINLPSLFVYFIRSINVQKYWYFRVECIRILVTFHHRDGWWKLYYVTHSINM